MTRTLVSVYYEMSYLYLYNLLEERDDTISIEHKEMPSYTDHVHFVNSKPYTAWYFIISNSNMVGSCYLTKKNEIGVFVSKIDKRQGHGSWAVKELMKMHGQLEYKANINPANIASLSLFSSLGFKTVSLTMKASLA